MPALQVRVTKRRVAQVLNLEVKVFEEFVNWHLPVLIEKLGA